MKKTRAAAPTKSLVPGFHLIVKLQEKRLTVLRSAPIRNAPRQGLEPPFLDPLKRYAFPLPVSELVLHVLDVKGGILESFAWPWMSEAFFDQPHPEMRGGLQGGRFKSDHPLRVLMVPVPPSATLLMFSRSDVQAGQQAQRVRRRGLALYSVASTPPVKPSLPFADPSLEVQPLPGAPRSAEGR